MKKVLKSSLVVASLVTLAATSTHANHPKSGFYAGAALGGTALTGKSNLSVRRNIPALGDVPQNFNPTIGDKNFAADIFVGFGKRFQCTWVGFEVLASLSSLNANAPLDITPLTTSDNGQFLSIKTTNAWGGTFNFGYYMNPTTKLYVKLGLESRRFRTNFNGTGNAAVAATDPNLLSIVKNTTSTAFVPGFGLETDLTPRLSLRTDYRIALHPRKTTNVTNSATQFSNIRTKPTVHYFNLGLVVKI
ncbi:MAG: porin family protein [Alphaproteobacteria bacterium]|nr:porin family protein [Alphaproteobacteria bacterium]